MPKLMNYIYIGRRKIDQCVINLIQDCRTNGVKQKFFHAICMKTLNTRVFVNLIKQKWIFNA